MNVSLYNALVDAYNFLLQDEKNKKLISKYEGQVKLHQLEYGMHTRQFRMEPEEQEGCGSLLFWTFFCFPLGLICHWIARKRRKAVRRKQELKNEREKEKLLKSPEEIEYRRQKAIEIDEAKMLLEKAVRQREEYYCANYQKYLGFLAEFQRNMETINAYIHYVKTGQAFTLDEARECYAKELRELYEMQERREEREERERQHRENQEMLGTIAKNQQEIQRQLDNANKIRTGVYYHR